MSLIALNWRKLPPRTVTGSSVNLILNNVYDMLTGSFYFDGTARVPGSGSAWKNVGRFITGSGTGSNTEAVYCYPPTQSVMSQSFLIAGINTVGAATLAANVAYASASAIKAGDFGIACIKNAGTFSSWSTGSNGFGAGSSSTGIACFCSASLIGTITPKITIYESQETIAIFFNDNVTATKTYGGISGAIIDPEQTTTSIDAEADNRLYGMTTTPCGATNGTNDGIQQTFLSGTTGYGLFNHTNNSLLGISLIFTPQSSITRGVSVVRPYSANFPINTISSRFIKFPMAVTGYSDDIFIGTLRGIYNYNNTLASNQVIRDNSGNIYGFNVGRAETAAGDSFLLPY